MTLSDKIHEEDYRPDLSVLSVKDVREFIRILKDFILVKGKLEKGEADYIDGYYDGTWDMIHTLNDEIDKLAGGKLI